MTRRFIPLALASLLASGMAFAQMPPPPGGPVPPPAAANAPGGPLPPPPLMAAPEAGTALNGRVAQWLINPNGEADGLLLTDGTQVAFPPHLSASAMQMLKPGDVVRVVGWRAPNVPVMRAQTLEANGRSLTDQPPAPGMAPPAPRDPATLATMSAQGRIERLLYTDRGDVRGVLLSDNTAVRFPPHIGAAYGALLQPGATLFARGWGTRGANGSAFEATSLGASADSVREVFGGPVDPAAQPGPRGPRAPRGPGAVPPVPPAALPAPAAS